MPMKRELYPDKWIDLLIHMTGSQKKRGQGWRNYAAAYTGDSLDEQLQGMQGKGLVEEYTRRWGMTYYRATQKGCEIIDMTKAGIQRAMGKTKKCR